MSAEAPREAGGTQGKIARRVEENRARSNVTLILQTLCIYMGFMCLGLCDSILGPTFADMQTLLGVDTTHLSAVFTATNVGYLTGAAVAGLLFDRLPAEPQLAAALGLAAVSVSVAPLRKDLFSFIVAMGVEGVGLAYVDAGTQTYCLSVWRGHRFQDAVVQGIFVAWSVGSTVGPPLMQPFLSITSQPSMGWDRNHGCSPDNNASLDLNITYLSTTDPNVPTDTQGNSTTLLSTNNGLAIGSGYILVGLILVPVSIMYLALYLVTRKGKDSISELSERPPHPSGTKQSFTAIQMSLVFAFSLFFLLYVGLEVTTGGFLPLFLIRGLCWSTRHSALPTSLFWSCTGIGRLIGAPISLYLKPVQMLLINLTLTMTAFLLLATLAAEHPAVMWGAVAAAGIGVSTVYPAAYLWCSRYVRVTGLVTGVFLFVGSIGSMTLPLVTGIFMERVNPWTFTYLMATISGVLLVMCIAMWVYLAQCMPELATSHEQSGNLEDNKINLNELEETERLNCPEEKS